MNWQIRVVKMATGIWGKLQGKQITDEVFQRNGTTIPDRQKDRGKNRGSLAVNKGRSGYQG